MEIITVISESFLDKVSLAFNNEATYIPDTVPVPVVNLLIEVVSVDAIYPVSINESQELLIVTEAFCLFRLSMVWNDTFFFSAPSTPYWYFILST